MLFASWYLRVNLTFPMNSKLEQRFDKMRQGRDKVTCRTFICLSIQQIFEGRLLRASPVLRHNTGQGMWPRDRALALHSSAEGFLRMSSLFQLCNSPLLRGQDKYDGPRTFFWLMGAILSLWKATQTVQIKSSRKKTLSLSSHYLWLLLWAEINCGPPSRNGPV